MKLDEKEIRPNPTPLYVFKRTKAQPIRDVTLLVTAAGKTLFVTFVIINALSAYNAIMRRDWIHRMDGEASTRCQAIRSEDPPQQDQENNDQEPPTIEPLKEEVLDPTDPEK
ncbi:hypothetical protein ACFX12_029573 [Malus domestica]